MNILKNPRFIALSVALCLSSASLSACSDTEADRSGRLDTGWLTDSGKTDSGHADSGSLADSGQTDAKSLPDTNDITDTTQPPDIDEREFAPGSIAICFQHPQGDADSDSHQSFEKIVTGTIVFDKAIAEVEADAFDGYCRNYSSRVLQVDTDTGQRWSVGYRALDHDENDITPTVDFEPGQTVELALKRNSGWGEYFTFSARNEDEVFLSMNDGGVQPLASETLEGLTVEVGEPSGLSDQESCGTRVGHELIFDAQTRSTLIGGERGTIELASGSASVMNIAAWYYENIQCEDVGGLDAWMVWRVSAP